MALREREDRRRWKSSQGRLAIGRRPAQDKEAAMATDIYERLAQHLDNLPAGYPRTDSGIELRILRRLFAPQEAELALHLTLLAEPARVIARRSKIPTEEAARRLREMERKGLIYAYHREGRDPEYMAAHWVIGIYEFQVNRMDQGFVQDALEYDPTWFDQSAWGKAPQLRTVPVGESIDAQLEVMPYEQAETLVRAHDRFAVAPCVCRREKQMAGKGCGKTVELCLMMGEFAAYYLHNDLGRPVDQEEALTLLAQAEEEGLVLQPSNTKSSANICACCGCCCGILTNVKRFPKPAKLVASAFLAAVDPESCVGCGTCEGRCQMKAIHLDDGKAVLDLDRCIGCGLCVTTCPAGSLSLLRKPKSEQPYVPRNLADAAIRLGQARGKLNPGKLVGMLVKSKVDRLLAPR
jgi:NAD-dependent dihydropyrimidine dehydrogenase PreA subunit